MFFAAYHFIYSECTFCHFCTITSYSLPCLSCLTDIHVFLPLTVRVAIEQLIHKHSGMSIEIECPDGPLMKDDVDSPESHH